MDSSTKGNTDMTILYLVSVEGNVKLTNQVPEGSELSNHASLFLVNSWNNNSVHLPFNGSTVRALYSLRQEPGKYGVASAQEHLEYVLNAILRGAQQ